MKTKYILWLIFLLGSSKFWAQKNLSLDSCRSLALAHNKEIKISQKEHNIAALKHKAALTNYYPKISAIGTYMRSEKELSLLNNEQKEQLSQLGTHFGTKFQEVGQLLGQKYPNLSPIIKDFGNQVGTRLVPALDQIGNSLVENFRTDTRNLYVGAINLKQPLFVGGKIRSYARITSYLEDIAANNGNLSKQEVIVKTDQAYWLVVSLSNKKKLADSYVALLEKMDSDVTKMIQEGIATKADGLTVKVKANEAAMIQMKVDNGLQLAKMVLCQICGLPIESTIALQDENNETLNTPQPIANVEIHDAVNNRLEIQNLTLASLAKKEKIKIERAEFLPQVAISGNYLVTNPATTNGFENKFKGMWSVGLQVKIPIWHWREGMYKVNAARQEAEIMQYKLEETEEKITLQINQAKFKVKEAQKQLASAKKNIEKAEENLRYAKLGFKEGVIPPSDVLKAHTAWFDAQGEKIDAQIEVQLSSINLNKALGILRIEK